jgi:hypothetical protein
MTYLMDQETATNIRPDAGSAWQRAGRKLARMPLKVWVVIALFSVAAAVLALHTARTDKSASLHLKVQHGLRNGELSVWVDGERTCSDQLTGYVRKKFGLIPESLQGSLSRTVPLSPGHHQIRVHVSGDDGFNQEDSISGDFTRNTERTLAVVTRRSGLALSWQGAASVPAESFSALAWLGRYASTLLVTIAGSIISALTGFAVREVPAYIRRKETSSVVASEVVPAAIMHAPPKARSAAAGQ